MFFEKDVHVFAKTYPCFAKKMYMFCRNAPSKILKTPPDLRKRPTAWRAQQAKSTHKAFPAMRREERSLFFMSNLHKFGIYAGLQTYILP